MDYKRIMKLAVIMAVALQSVLVCFTSCERVPPLHLHRDRHVEVVMPIVNLDLSVYWDYYVELEEDWRAQWTYGWDDTDRKLFGEIGYTMPEEFEIRRYYLGYETNKKHNTVDKFHIVGNRLRTVYDFGYYDILAWNDIYAPEGIQSVVIDEETSLDEVTAFTNSTLSPAIKELRVKSKYPNSFYQPEEFFAGYERNIYVSDNFEDYDYFDEATNTYYKNLTMEIHPLTYIYLTQVRLHNNRGRIDGVAGEANLSGMARSVTLNNGMAGSDAISVHYNVRFKRSCRIQNTGEMVDVAGGRCLTFGIPNQNSSRVMRASEVKDDVRHYMDVNFIFNNGKDSTFVFDVTDQVRKFYKGGVLTVDLDVDSVKIPTISHGSGFNAEVEDYEMEEIEFEM
ncbi:MAG: DUF5119 domain-containing protein [Bacteroidaceae bacterium]|nr:DUF5119 domain-containing protein [Bacteroidaceae bacterium]